MTLSKKKSRPIKVDAIDFRYIISTSLVDDEWNFKLNITIQTEEGEGSVLSIKGLDARDFWLDFSDPPRSFDTYPVILPNHIEKFIKQAIIEGWNPKKKGPQFFLELDNKSVFSK